MVLEGIGPKASTVPVGTILTEPVWFQMESNQKPKNTLRKDKALKQIPKNTWRT